MKQKRRIKIWIVLIIVWVMSFSDWSFATVDIEWELWSLTWFLNILISIVSWLWVIFAKIAWEFLTNKWVYGEILWIDVLLWQYRNIVKNMANFCLWFYLVYVIFKWLIWQYGGKEEIIKNLKNMLLRVLIAWIWIQASWFLTSVVVDVSTVVLTAVWSLPAQIVSENENLNNAILSWIGKFGTWTNVYNLFPEWGAANSFTEMWQIWFNGNLNEEQLMDEILPKKDSVSGPLFYMGWSILRTNEINSVNDTNLKKSIINLVVQGWTTIVYSIEIAVLCVLALMRIVYLWMFIVLSPLAVLLACLQKSWEKDLMSTWFVSSLLKQINLKAFFLKVFQPSVIVLWISLCLIFVSLINGILNANPTKSMENFDIGWAKITTFMDPKEDQTSQDVTYTTNLDWNLVRLSFSRIWKWFLDFMMAIITVVVVYWVIKTAVKMWWWDDFVSKGINNLQDTVTETITSIPFVPVPWYDKQWVPTTKAISWQWLKSLPQRKLDSMIREKTTITNSQVDSLMNEWWLVNPSSLTQSEKTAIMNAWSSAGLAWLKVLEAKRDYINDKIKSENWKWMVLNPNASDQFWRQEFTKWLNKTESTDVSQPDWREMLVRWHEKKEEERDLSKLFSNPTYAKAYADFFGYTGNYTDFNSIMNLDISRETNK